MCSFALLNLHHQRKLVYEPFHQRWLVSQHGARVSVLTKLLFRVKRIAFQLKQLRISSTSSQMSEVVLGVAQVLAQSRKGPFLYDVPAW